MTVCIRLTDKEIELNEKMLKEERANIQPGWDANGSPVYTNAPGIAKGRNVGSSGQGLTTKGWATIPVQYVISPYGNSHSIVYTDTDTPEQAYARAMSIVGK